MLFLGIDLGTGGVRCILVNEEGRIVAEVSHGLQRLNLSNKQGESEQDAAEWISVLESALDELFSVPQNRTISAVAVDSTSGTVLPVDKVGDPIGSALMHNDVRAVEESELCRNIFGGDCSPTFSLPKILWMKKYLSMPEDTLFLHATDFLNSWLAGATDVPTDFTNAMKTGVDLETGDWSGSLPSLNLPRVVSPGEVIGELSHALRSRWGLAGSCILVSGATDSNAAFYASGAGKTGDWSTTIGTTLAVKGLSPKRLNDPLGRIYCHRHPDGHWLPGGASNGGGEILRTHFGEKLNCFDDELKVCIPSIVPPIVYPSVRQGERLPISDPAFIPFGHKDKHNDLNFYLGCLEGLSFLEKMTYDLIEELGGQLGSSVFATGGAASSIVGLQIRADVMQRSISVPEHPNSAMGSAILAAAGFTSRKVGDVSKDLVNIVTTIEPATKPDQSRTERFLSFQEKCKAFQA